MVILSFSPDMARQSSIPHVLPSNIHVSLVCEHDKRNEHIPERPSSAIRKGVPIITMRKCQEKLISLLLL